MTRPFLRVCMSRPFLKNSSKYTSKLKPGASGPAPLQNYMTECKYPYKNRLYPNTYAFA